jgi:hypothetical protein
VRAVEEEVEVPVWMGRGMLAGEEDQVCIPKEPYERALLYSKETY